MTTDPTPAVTADVPTHAMAPEWWLRNSDAILTALRADPASARAVAAELLTVEALALDRLATELVLRAGHLPSCGEGAEFPWECTCDYEGFMDRMGAILAALGRKP